MGPRAPFADRRVPWIWTSFPPVSSALVPWRSFKSAHIQCVRKVAVHLQKVLEVMSTSVYTELTELNNYTLYRYCTSTAV
jgi:hypothetical protein